MLVHKQYRSTCTFIYRLLIVILFTLLLGLLFLFILEMKTRRSTYYYDNYTNTIQSRKRRIKLYVECVEADQSSVRILDIGLQKNLKFCGVRVVHWRAPQRGLATSFCQERKLLDRRWRGEGELSHHASSSVFCLMYTAATFFSST